MILDKCSNYLLCPRPTTEFGKAVDIEVMIQQNKASGRNCTVPATDTAGHAQCQQPGFSIQEEKACFSRKCTLTVSVQSAQFTLRILKMAMYDSSLTWVLAHCHGATIKLPCSQHHRPKQQMACSTIIRLPYLIRIAGTGPRESELLRCLLNGGSEGR